MTPAMIRPSSSLSIILHHPKPYFQRSTVSPTQTRYATLIRRPQRPYTFTQLMTLSDGSTTMVRTTSPLPVYKTVKDARNNPLWNPSLRSLANLEEDDAGRLRAFRRRFGRGWDADAALKEREMDERHDLPSAPSYKDADGGTATGGGSSTTTAAYENDDDQQGGLLDLISGFRSTPGKSAKEKMKRKKGPAGMSSPSEKTP